MYYLQNLRTLFYSILIVGIPQTLIVWETLVNIANIESEKWGFKVNATKALNSKEHSFFGEEVKFKIHFTMYTSNYGELGSRLNISRQGVLFTLLDQNALKLPPSYIRSAIQAFWLNRSTICCKKITSPSHLKEWRNIPFKTWMKKMAWNSQVLSTWKSFFFKLKSWLKMAWTWPITLAGMTNVVWTLNFTI